MTQTIFLPFTSGTLSNITAATLDAPAPSATVFCVSINVNIAVAISSSVTVTTPSRYFLHISNVKSPGFFTAIPSAIVDTLSSSIISPLLIESYILGAPAACTPYTLQSGFTDFIAQATPLAKPPPPIATNTASTCGSCSNISSPIVPCPAITFSSLKGCTNV